MKWFIKKNIFSFDTMELLSVDLTQELTLCNPVHSGFEAKVVRQIDQELEERIEKAILKMEFKKTFDLKEAKKRLANGYYFAYALSQADEVVGWSWAAVEKVYFGEFNRSIEIDSNEAFTYNAYVKKEYRGRKINHLLKISLINQLKMDGFKKFWGLIYPWNNFSIKSLESLGFKHDGKVFHLKLFFLDFIMMKRH